MIAVLLTIHSLIVLALIGVVLLQRSEGGALGMGGGGMGGFMTGRGTANLLTRTTSVLAFFFFTTSILLGVFHSRGESDERVIQELTGGQASPAPAGDAPKSADDLLRSLGTGTEPAAGGETPAQAPAADAPAEDSPAPTGPANETATPPQADSPAETPEPSQEPNR